MQRTPTLILVALSVFALAGVGLATVSAQDDPATEDVDESSGIYKWWPKHLKRTHFVAHQFAQCDDNITVGECKEQIKAAAYERCLEHYDQETCDQRVAEFEQRREAREQAIANGETPTGPPGGFGHRPGGPPGGHPGDGAGAGDDPSPDSA